MQKTKKSVAKRFKLTASGKLMHRSPGTRHHASQKSSKQKRRLGRRVSSPTPIRRRCCAACRTAETHPFARRVNSQPTRRRST